MVECEFGGREAAEAILTGVVIPREDVSPVELDVLTRHPVERQYANDAGCHQRRANGTYPILIVAVLFAPHRAKLRPVFKVVGDVSSVLDVDDFGHRLVGRITFEQENKSAAHAHDAERGIVGVKQQDVAFEARGWIGECIGCEDSTSSRNGRITSVMRPFTTNYSRYSNPTQEKCAKQPRYASNTDLPGEVFVCAARRRPTRLATGIRAFRGQVFGQARCG